MLLAIVSIPVSSASFTATTDNTTNSFGGDTLDPPTSVTATGTGPVTIDWTATADTYATGHRVFRSTSTGGPYTQIATTTPRTTTSYIDNPASGTYYYVVRAYHQGWESADSNEVTATVSAFVAGDVSDDFDSRDFDGDDGTISWNEASWTQLVETDGALSGKVKVENPYWTNCDGASYCLTIGGEAEASIAGRGVERSLDLTGATTATLTYTVEKELYWNSGGSVQVQASSDGISWTPLATYTFSGGSSPVNESFSLMPHASAQTRLRIVGTGLEGGYIGFSWIRIDLT